MVRWFARMHAATIDAPEDVRLSIDAMAARIDAGGLDAPDTASLIDELSTVLMGEVARRHR
jgi:DNA-binding ferritin-like protein